MTSHNLDRGLELCTQAAILKAGTLVYREDIATVDKGDFKNTYLKFTGKKPLLK